MILGDSQLHHNEENKLLKSVPVRMVLYHLNRYLLGLVLTYLCTYHRTEEFIIALADYVVS